MKLMREPMKPLPKSREDWLAEIVAAYLDAREAIPFGEVLGEPFRDATCSIWRLLWLSSSAAIRGRARREKSADEAALASYAANVRVNRSVLKDPRLAFALCYLASHYGLRLLTAERAEELMADMERNRKALARLIAGGPKSNTALHRTGARDARSCR